MRHFLAGALLAALGAAPAQAQTPSRPGPWTLDVRAVTSAVPAEAAFYPRLDSSTLVPTRGLGLEGGVHVYLFNLGPSRVGLGAALFNVRGVTKPPPPAPDDTTPPTGGTTVPPAETEGQSVQVDLRMVTPQVSFNFGSRGGWSYLSAGLGITEVITRTAGTLAGRRETSGLRTINFGGGARWFMKSHLAFGFDLRFHRVPSGTAGPIEEARPDPSPGGPVVAPPGTPTPGKMVVTVSAGLSFR